MMVAFLLLLFQEQQEASEEILQICISAGKRENRESNFLLNEQ